LKTDILIIFSRTIFIMTRLH